MSPEATELEFLQWYYQNADFGPAHRDVVQILHDDFERTTGMKVPAAYVQS